MDKRRSPPSDDKHELLHVSKDLQSIIIKAGSHQGNYEGTHCDDIDIKIEKCVLWKIFVNTIFCTIYFSLFCNVHVAFTLFYNVQVLN